MSFLSSFLLRTESYLHNQKSGVCEGVDEGTRPSDTGTKGLTESGLMGARNPNSSSPNLGVGLEQTEGNREDGSCFPASLLGLGAYPVPTHLPEAA